MQKDEKIPPEGNFFPATFRLSDKTLKEGELLIIDEMSNKELSASERIFTSAPSHPGLEMERAWARA